MAVYSKDMLFMDEQEFSGEHATFIYERYINDNFYLEKNPVAQIFV